MSGSRWVITPLWLSGSLRPFLYSSSVYSCHLFFNVFCFSQVLAVYLSFIGLIFAWTVPWVSPVFLKRSLVFPILLFPSISWLCSQKSFLSLFPILWNSAFSWVYLSLSPLPFTFLLFSTVCKASLENHLTFLHFFFLGMVLVTTTYTVVQTSIYSSSALCLPDLVPWIYLLPPLNNHKGFYLRHTCMA